MPRHRSTALLGLVLPIALPHDPVLHIRDLTAEIRRTPSIARLYLARARYRLLEEQLVEARRDLEQATRLDPALAGLDWTTARVHYAARRYEQALASATAAAAREPGHGAAHRLCGRALMRLGQHDKAARAFAIARKYLRPTRPEYFFEHASALAACGRIDAALGVLDAGCRELGPLVSLATKAIELELARGNAASAVRRIARLLQSVDRKEPWLVWSAEILHKAGRRDQAGVHARAALAEIDSLPRRLRARPATRNLRARAERVLNHGQKCGKKVVEETG